MIVNTKTERTVLFLCKHNRGSCWRFGRVDKALLEHVVNVVMEDLQLQLGLVVQWTPCICTAIKDFT